MTVIPQRDLRNKNAQIMDRVKRGESFVVTHEGVPVADVVPHVASDRPPMFPKTSELAGFLKSTGVDAQAWLADIRASDSFLTDDPFEDPWERHGRA